MLRKSKFNSAAHACAHRVTYDCKMLYGQRMASSKLSTSAPTPQPNLHSSRGPLLLCLQTVDSLKRNVPRSDEIRGAALLAGMPCRPHPHRKPARKICSPTSTSWNNSPFNEFIERRKRSISLKLWQGKMTRRSPPPNIFGSDDMATRRHPTCTLRA